MSEATPYPPREWLWCRTCDGSGLYTLDEPLCPRCDGTGKIPATSQTGLTDAEVEALRAYVAGDSFDADAINSFLTKAEPVHLRLLAADE